MKKYLGLQDPKLPAFLTELEVQSTPVNDQQIITFGSLDGTDPTEEEKTERRLLAGKLDVFLSNLVLGQTIALLKGAETPGSAPNGFETWRIIATKNKAEKNATAHALMMQLINFRFTASTFEKDLENFEVLKTRYESVLGKPCEDSLLVGIMFNKTSVLPALLSHIRLHSEKYTTYQAIRALIVHYLRTEKLGNTTGPDINALHWSKGKGKRNHYGKGNYGRGNYGNYLTT